MPPQRGFANAENETGRAVTEVRPGVARVNANANSSCRQPPLQGNLSGSQEQEGWYRG